MGRIHLQCFTFTLSCLRNSQQYQRISLICLIHKRVRSLERARDTYHTYKENKEKCNGQLQGSSDYVLATGMGPISSVQCQVRQRGPMNK